MIKSLYHIVSDADALVFKEIHYPAGEMQIRFNEKELPLLRGTEEICVTARLRDGNDLMRLALLASAIKGIQRGSTPRRVLILPYLPYSRADRRFTDGDCFGLETFGTIINRMQFGSVVTLDAHSKVAASCINGLVDVSPLPLIEKAILRFAGDNKRVCVLFPDEGARNRYVLPEVIGNNVHQVKVDVLHCSKIRDPKTGALSGFSVPHNDQINTRRVLIVDDICDGGRTFLGIAEKLASLDLVFGLYVTHGIFSNGMLPLTAVFERIYTTNSFTQGVSGDDAHQFECESLLGRAAMQIL